LRRCPPGGACRHGRIWWDRPPRFPPTAAAAVLRSDDDLQRVSPVLKAPTAQGVAVQIEKIERIERGSVCCCASLA
jgi:hypothetical protein